MLPVIINAVPQTLLAVCWGLRMKIFVNPKIKRLFGGILLCVLFFTLIAVLLMVFEVRNAAAYTIACFLLMSAAILALLFGYFREQHRSQNIYPAIRISRLNVTMKANYTDYFMK